MQLRNAHRESTALRDESALPCGARFRHKNLPRCQIPQLEAVLHGDGPAAPLDKPQHPQVKRKLAARGRRLEVEVEWMGHVAGRQQRASEADHARALGR
eukprot:scaffold190021_cov28-Tisochrysis_lutea.AAC.1